MLLKHPGDLKFKMAVSFKILTKVGITYSLNTLGAENFYEIALPPAVKEIEVILCFATFG